MGCRGIQCRARHGGGAKRDAIVPRVRRSNRTTCLRRSIGLPPGATSSSACSNASSSNFGLSHEGGFVSSGERCISPAPFGVFVLNPNVHRRTSRALSVRSCEASECTLSLSLHLYTLRPMNPRLEDRRCGSLSVLERRPRVDTWLVFRAGHGGYW